MTEIYWLTRLDSISALLFSLSVFSAIATILSFTFSMLPDDFQESTIVKMNKIFKYSLATLFLSAVINTLVPSTKDAFIIYGVGGTIDYIKSSDKAKQLPDKVVDALDKYVESLTDSIK